jgi:16S rRNA processing protein RimM
LSTDLKRRFVPLAEVARPHGVRGEVRLRLFNADSDMLLDRDEVIVQMPDGKQREASVDGARRADKTILLKLRLVDDRDRAEQLRGAMVGVRRCDLPALDEGEMYACDVEGAEVKLGAARVGVVERLEEYPTSCILVVRMDDGTSVDVPFIHALIKDVDVEAHVVTLHALEMPS